MSKRKTDRQAYQDFDTKEKQRKLAILTVSLIPLDLTCTTECFTGPVLSLAAVIISLPAPPTPCGKQKYFICTPPIILCDFEN